MLADARGDKPVPTDPTQPSSHDPPTYPACGRIFTTAPGGQRRRPWRVSAPSQGALKPRGAEGLAVGLEPAGAADRRRRRAKRPVTRRRSGPGDAAGPADGEVAHQGAGSGLVVAMCWPPHQPAACHITEEPGLAPHKPCGLPGAAAARVGAARLRDRPAPPAKPSRAPRSISDSPGAGPSRPRPCVRVAACLSLPHACPSTLSEYA